MKIKRTVDGKEHSFTLSPLEIAMVYAEGRVLNAKNVLELHQEEIDPKSYRKIMKDEPSLLRLGEDLGATC